MSHSVSVSVSAAASATVSAPAVPDRHTAIGDGQPPLLTAVAPAPAVPGGRPAVPADVSHPPAVRRAGSASTAKEGVDGIGDIALAGRPSGYPHLSPRPLVTAGRLVAAARAAAAALALAPSSTSRRFRRHRGHWYPAPRPARRAAPRGLRVEVAALGPGESAELPGRPHRPAARRAVALHLVHGEAELVTHGPDEPGVRPLPGGTTRLLGAPHGHRLVNTGSVPVLAVRVLA
ncbi:hypothetical protein HNR23_005049 [Nocardiopsis mwathae]|uniref:Cupin domain-containing protein n=1 Tax=Nocardiopsis mwathae TaxID=1472723 RepID=A0A7W9YN05_9ACTN|nr:hypothetical protein [Nocardiopsis mwathae]MBB6174989.1 hypothetical protein [Nocardiopsis mwathae]